MNWSTYRRIVPAVVAALACAGVSPAFGADAKSAKATPSFGLLQAPSGEAVRAQALAWLPRLLILDEVTATLPADLTERVFRVARRYSMT